jgi:murein DD-endopeptidase MepM/ murein hydrolase activator NlpD
MNPRKHKTLRRVLAVLLALALLVPLSGPMTTVESSAAVTQAEIDALKKNASNIQSQKSDIQKQLKEVQADKSQAQAQKRLIEQQINLIQDEIDNIQSQIEMYEELIAQKEEELAQTQEKEQAQYELFCQRIRSMEEEGEDSYWSILFSSSSFSDLLDNFMMIEEFIQYDNSVMDTLLALQVQIESDKADLESSKAEEEAAKAEQETAKAEQKSKQAEVDALITQISAQEDELEAQEAELKKAAAAADAQIKAKEKELAAQIAKVVSESGFQWPLSGSYNTLSSLYGSRIHPVTGKPSNHTGIDIPAPSGTPIYAAKSGVVSTSVYGSGSSWSYGNYVVISHSDGTSTLYAHMSKRAVSEGQTVKQGAVIGYVGTTGRSTGNHLHFEVRVNGNRTDPINYFKSMTLYATSNGKKSLLSH